MRMHTSVRHAGFTMVELVVVIVLIGILSTVAVSRFGSTKQFDAAAFAQEIKSLVQFGQKLAIAQNRAVYVTATATRIALCYDAACAQRVNVAGGNSARRATIAACGTNWACESVPSGLTLTVPVAGMFFNAVGRPFALADSPAGDTSTFTSLAITITGGDTPQSIIIEQETGYVR